MTRAASRGRPLTEWSATNGVVAYERKLKIAKENEKTIEAMPTPASCGAPNLPTRAVSINDMIGSSVIAITAGNAKPDLF